jgi:hypothetical protein
LGSENRQKREKTNSRSELKMKAIGYMRTAINYGEKGAT